MCDVPRGDQARHVSPALSGYPGCVPKSGECLGYRRDVLLSHRLSSHTLCRRSVLTSQRHPRGQGRWSRAHVRPSRGPPTLLPRHIHPSSQTFRFRLCCAEVNTTVVFIKYKSVDRSINCQNCICKFNLIISLAN